MKSSTVFSVNRIHDTTSRWKPEYLSYKRLKLALLALSSAYNGSAAR